MNGSSNLSGFYKLPYTERLKIVKEFANLSEEEADTLQRPSSLPLSVADKMIENVIGVFPVPLGIAVNFLINGRDYLIPMATEEPSVVAAASHAAKLARAKGGFRAIAPEPLMKGQIQVIDVKDPRRAQLAILAEKERILAMANEKHKSLLAAGGGAKDLEVKLIDTSMGTMLIVELVVDCRDAMGANATNSMAEEVAPLVSDLSGGRTLLRIISNMADKRVARAWAVFDREAIGGEEVVDGILAAYAFAASDPFRCATHNKGIMNGVSAVALATGNDTRAIEAGAHAFASRSGRYAPLTCWEKNAEGDLVGSIEIPVAAGVVGGAVAIHPLAKLALKILRVSTAGELGQVLAAVGLAQNFAALRALVTEGIQKGHMALHARNIAMAAGARGELADRIAERMVRERAVKLDRAREILSELNGSDD